MPQAVSAPHAYAARWLRSHGLHRLSPCWHTVNAGDLEDSSWVCQCGPERLARDGLAFAVTRLKIKEAGLRVLGGQ